MFKEHTTKDGNSMLICQMTDSHLINTIRYYCLKMEEAQKTLENQTSCNIVTQVLNKKLVANLVESLTLTIMHIDSVLPNYIMEASLRGLDVTQFLRLAYGRSEGLTTPKVLSNSKADKLKQLEAELPSDLCFEEDEGFFDDSYYRYGDSN